MKKLSVIVPAYNEEETVELFYDAFAKVENQMDVEPELIFVDDGSKDKTLVEIKKLQKLHEEIHYISFSRNFGKEAALYAGLQKASGELVAVMDIDLQDPPELLPQMIKMIEEGEYDSVATRRKDRDGESPVRSFFARQFYKWINKVSSLELVDGARDFRVMTRQMVDSVLSMRERERFSKGLFNWVGFNTYYISYENRERAAGKTSWSFWGLMKYAIEGFVSFSTAPLSFVTSAGIATCVLAVLGALAVIVRAITFPHTSAFGWPSLVVIILFFSGVQLLSLGIIGRYIAEVYLEVKDRPVYIVREEK
ncbi:glycosyltransferase family 2 protein [Pediococcus acidilactici]|uniref:glycosyltransferase family 2 protein n=1 Tax=Pediococcus acidilactici TaxID=1254 RepID=UPI001321FDE0|nr:glycosyltransferase family 2 protein [Pediococcus acidilactici]KAF0335000.1 glycosyltransferase [Pediococcus acidilactici]KAF0346361.1 glycosyltransferase [Pediococcus acidilactici]KAF0397700.1 glycosyltransferase [Pediococcus acidilactici]KAF0411184.1 glycosyltransferase [Pediococcus acidilactici]KAF0436491.1 glycosyltransferase [Pediococcus acidilactici]